MNHANDLSMAITKLRQCNETVMAVSDTLAAIVISQGGKQSEESTPAPEPKPITLEEVRAVLAAKSVQGYTAEVQALIHKRGLEKLSQVDPAQYADLLTEAEAL